MSPSTDLEFSCDRRLSSVLLAVEKLRSEDVLAGTSNPPNHYYVIVTTLSGVGYASVNEHNPLQTVL